jgi:tripartite-type tricarboxylate transporter receptor subunit TctC
MNIPTPRFPTRMPARRRLFAALALAAIAAAPGAAFGQAFPSKPLKWYVGSVPGGGQDLTARWLAAILSKSLGQPIIVENRGGAGGTLAVDAAAKAAPDGYTYAVTSNGAMLNAVAMYPSLPYDPGRDLVPVGGTFVASFAVTVGPNSKINTIQEFVSEVKANPGKYSYASAGKGSPHFLAMELLKQRLSLDLPDISYRSTAPAAVDVASGQVPFGMIDLATARPHFQSGKMRPLAVTGKERWAQFPNVPTVHETLAPGFEAFAWNAIVAPAGTPRDIVQRMSKELVAAVKSEEIAKRYAEIGFTPWPTSTEEMQKVMKDGLAFWPDMIRKLGIKAE